MIVIALTITLLTLAVIAIIADRQPKKREKIKKQIRIKSTYIPQNHETTAIN